MYQRMLALSLLLAGCAAPSKAPPVPPISLPVELTFKEVGLPEYNATVYQLTSNGVFTRTVETMRRGGSIKREKERRYVTVEAWQKFQARVEPLHIPSWKAEYEPKEMIYDGGHWDLTWASDGIRVVSTGSNAGPDPKNPSKVIVPMAENDCKMHTGDEIFSDAMNDLWAHSSTSH